MVEFVKSVGIIIYFKKNNSIEYLLLKHLQGHYSFPKGHQEKDETDEETALRELKEETGIGINDIILDKEFKIAMKYAFRHKLEMIFKTVYFYAAESKTKKIQISSEHTEYKWLPYEEAYNALRFKNSKEILKKADKYIRGKFPQK